MTTAAAEPESMTGGGFCRVQIAGPTTRVDLSLPTAVPLAALLPGIVAFAEQNGAAPQGWALSRLDGTRLDPAAALAVAGIREGELLLLHPAHDRVGAPLYDDVVEVLAEGAGESGWSARETRAAAAVLSGLAVLGAVRAGVTVGSPLAGVLLGVLTLLLLGGGAALSHAAGDVPAGTVAGALAAITGAAFGGEAGLGGCEFARSCRFDSANFVGGAGFDRAVFHAEASFADARFDGTAWFREVRFRPAPDFDRARFSGAVKFEGAQIADMRSPHGERFEMLRKSLGTVH